MKYESFSLVLMVNHACNLRCTYCYTGAKTPRPMSRTVARQAVEAAINSVQPGGVLELGFFGGEPLLEAELILEVLTQAEQQCAKQDVMLRPGLTCNGTIASAAAWQVMTWPGLHLHISHDGLPDVHDLHRVHAGPAAAGSSDQVLDTIGRLIAAEVDLRVMMVVRPDTVARMPDGVAWLRSQGVRYVDPSLDLWCRWEREDLEVLEDAICRAAELWIEGLPECGLGWFDERVASLASSPNDCGTARCSWGSGEVAVAPSGRLYPCERVIGEDPLDHPLRLPAELADCGDFLFQNQQRHAPDECNVCPIQSQCNTFCRCSNYVRTGDVHRPDGLLCFFNQICQRETARALRRLATSAESLTQLPVTQTFNTEDPTHAAQ